MIGETVSHYKILEELGAGGMGVVYKARDLKLDRPVAIKFLSPQLSTHDKAKKRFTQEAKAASALDHPSICTIHEIDETPDGRMFIVMAYYEGETLRQRMEREAVSLEEALDFVIQVASGLSEAHERGIVHRDIKPGNIFIGKGRRVKIVDFGLAKLAGQTKLTRSGSRIGTCAFMSPEQAMGQDVDQRSDIFSLGAVLYELLTGRLPFPGDHDAAVTYGIIHNDPEPLVTNRGDVPASLELIVSKALNKEAGKRYQSALDLRTELEELRKELAGSEIMRSRGTRQARKVQVWIRRRGALAAVILGLILVAATLTFLWQYRSEPPPQDLALAVVDFRDLAEPDDNAVSAGITSLIHVGLVESGPCRIVSLAYLHDLRRRLFGSAHGPIEEDQALEVARSSGAKMLLTGQLTTLDTGQYLAWQLIDTGTGKSLHGRRIKGTNLAVLADAVIEDVLPLIAELSGVEPPIHPPSVARLTTESPEAYHHYVQGMLAAEGARPREAVRELERAVQLDSSFALALYELGRVHQHLLADKDLAREYGERAWQQRTRLGIKDRMRLEAWRRQTDEEIGDALILYRELCARWPDDREVIGELGRVLIFWWYFHEAVDVLKRGVELYPDDYQIILWYKNALLVAGRAKEAMELVRTYLDGNRSDPSAWDDLGWAFGSMGLPDSAETAFRAALDIDPKYLWSQLGIGRCIYQRGDLDGAIDYYERILAQPELAPGQRVWILTHVRSGPHGLPFFYAEGGQFAKAMETFEEARRFISGPRGEFRLEVQRTSLLLRIGQPKQVLSRALGLVERAKDSSTRCRAQVHVARAWVMLDSLELARAVVPKLLVMEENLGALARFAAKTVAAEIALKEHDSKAALESLYEAGKYLAYSPGLREIEYFETLAKAYRMAGQLNEAIDTHHELLRVYGGHALSHYELGCIYEELGRQEDAEREYAKFLEMWSDADEELPQPEDARVRLASLNARL